MAETKPGTPPGRARIGNTGEVGRRQPAPCLGHHPRGEGLPVRHLAQRSRGIQPNRRSATASPAAPQATTIASAPESANSDAPSR